LKIDLEHHETEGINLFRNIRPT